MSKIKNTPEFQRMIDEQELASSFHYQEQERERQEMFDLLSKQDAIRTATVEYLEALKVFATAQKKYSEILKENSLQDMDADERESAGDMLRDMFKGFDPNS